MPNMITVNANAMRATLTLIGGEAFADCAAMIYEALNKAEHAGFNEGYDEGYSDADTATVTEAELIYDDGYDSGYADGFDDGVEDGDVSDDAIEEFNTEDSSDHVKPNAQVEGFKFLLEDAPDWGVAKAVAALDDRPF
jgi:hypothetical protein